MAGEVALAAKWTGFVAAILTVALGLTHLILTKADRELSSSPVGSFVPPADSIRVKWPSDGFINDEEARMHWRAPMFTFVPDVCADVWTPFFLGAVGVGFHLKEFSYLGLIGKTFAHYFFYLLILALFGNLGYNGGFGIICGAVSLVACLLSVIAFFVEDQFASLGLSIGVKIRHRG